MRQNIPPYLQILFTARPPLPFITPTTKPKKIRLEGFFNNLDYNSMLKVSNENRANRIAESNEMEIQYPKKYCQLISFKEKESQWENKMIPYLNNLHLRYKQWKSEVNSLDSKKSRNPFKTIIVYNLVFL